MDTKHNEENILFVFCWDECSMCKPSGYTKKVKIKRGIYWYDENTQRMEFLCNIHFIESKIEEMVWKSTCEYTQRAWFRERNRKPYWFSNFDEIKWKLVVSNAIENK